MLFGLFGKRKKYPFNKMGQDAPKVVYGGPEMLRPASGTKDEASLKIYAGPPKDIGRPAAPAPEEDPNLELYAGPPVPPPEEDDPTEPLKPVYAGPDYSESRRPE